MKLIKSLNATQVILYDTHIYTKHKRLTGLNYCFINNPHMQTFTLLSNVLIIFCCCY